MKRGAIIALAILSGCHGSKADQRDQYDPIIQNLAQQRDATSASDARMRSIIDREIAAKLESQDRRIEALEKQQSRLDFLESRVHRIEDAGNDRDLLELDK